MENDLNAEIIIVDDDSTDNSHIVYTEIQKKYTNVKILIRRWELGLASAVVYGFNNANGEILGVMDADLSHDVKITPHLLKVIQEEKYDIAIGSRYIRGGQIDKTWPIKRKLFSKVAKYFASGLTNVNDPLSGYFFLKKSILDGIKLRTTGFKICLEILIKTHSKKVKEIPYTFTDRKGGKSKASMLVFLGYLVQLCDLYYFKYISKWLKR